MTETDQRLDELENQVKDLYSLSSGLIKLLFLSLSYHTQNGSLTQEQKITIKEKLGCFLDEPALEQIFDNMEYAEEMTEITNAMKF